MKNQGEMASSRQLSNQLAAVAPQAKPEGRNATPTRMLQKHKTDRIKGRLKILTATGATDRAKCSPPPRSNLGRLQREERRTELS